ncbi:uncharacterized protein DS421_5g143710 [Arachis hypogaea]|nr:uncharacterized protein DS421_5g143680 [Arachis hypogaea]QHO41203.1 uncharacterized protein DS421_5g143710 [Arachis hypogaea]
MNRKQNRRACARVVPFFYSGYHRELAEDNVAFVVEQDGSPVSKDEEVPVGEKVQERIKIVLLAGVAIPRDLQESEEEERVRVFRCSEDAVGIDEFVGEGVSSTKDDDSSVGEDLIRSVPAGGS